MAGLPWLEDLQRTLFDQYGEDVFEIDASFTSMFTFANGAEERSLGKITFPGFIGTSGGKFKVTGLDKPGPALLGMDYLSSLGFCIDFETGRCVVKALKQDFTLPRLANGHLFLDMCDHGALLQQAATTEAVTTVVTARQPHE